MHTGALTLGLCLCKSKWHLQLFLCGQKRKVSGKWIKKERKESCTLFLSIDDRYGVWLWIISPFGKNAFMGGVDDFCIAFAERECCEKDPYGDQDERKTREPS